MRDRHNFKGGREGTSQQPASPSRPSKENCIFELAILEGREDESSKQASRSFYLLSLRFVI